MIAGRRSRRGTKRTSGWIVLWGALSTDGADEVWTVIGEMTFLSAVEAGRVTHAFRVRVQLLRGRFWGWRLFAGSVSGSFGKRRVRSCFGEIGGLWRSGLICLFLCILQRERVVGVILEGGLVWKVGLKGS